MTPTKLLSLAAFLAVAFTAFKNLGAGDPPVRLFSLQSVPFAFLLWIALTIGSWIELAPSDIDNAEGFVLVGIVETTLALIATIYFVVCLARQR